MSPCQFTHKQCYLCMDQICIDSYHLCTSSRTPCSLAMLMRLTSLACMFLHTAFSPQPTKTQHAKAALAPGLMVHLSWKWHLIKLGLKHPYWYICPLRPQVCGCPAWVVLAWGLWFHSFLWSLSGFDLAARLSPWLFSSSLMISHSGSLEAQRN